MSKNKMLHILALFLVLNMVACTVSAADNGNNTLKVSNDIGTKESTLNTNLENKTVENNGGTVSNDSESNSIDTSFTQLEEDIKHSGGVLNLTHDYIYDSTKDKSYKEGILINSNLIINGNNHVIDGLNTARIFYIKSRTLTINNLIITNCSRSSGLGGGGAIRIDGGSLNVGDSSFINCSSSGSCGGAIYSDGSCHLNVGDSSFINCSCKESGGAIYSDGSLNVGDSSFINCSSCAIFHYDSLNIIDSSFINCSNGGIWNYDGNLNVKGSSFINCLRNFGGAIYASDEENIIVCNCLFENNTAYYGGAIYVDKSVNISNSTFNDNYANGRGGAVLSKLGVNVSDSSFTDNTCKNSGLTQSEGGAIYSDDSIIAKNSTFVRNYAADYGGAVWSDDSATVSDCDFENNTANDNEGGAIYEDDGSLSISNSTFNNNRGNSEGGATWSNKGTTVTNSSFTDNTCKGAKIMQCEGGAIYSDEDGVNIENSSFIRNYAGDYGGAVRSHDNINVKNSLFENNTASGNDGGAIYSYVGGVTIENSSFIRNYAEDYGGAIWSDDNINVDNSLFENNTADDNDGGALYADDYSVSLSNSTFIGNRAGDNGGVFYDNGMGDSDSICGCNIHDNFAGKRGGAVYMDSYYSHISLTGNAIYNNFAGYSEGLDVYTYGYFDTINGNWWGTNDPDWGKHLLYEHRTFLPNVDHSDSNPLNYNPFNKLNTSIVASK